MESIKTILLATTVLLTSAASARENITFEQIFACSGSTSTASYEFVADADIRDVINGSEVLHSRYKVTKKQQGKSEVVLEKIGGFNRISQQGDDNVRNLSELGALVQRIAFYDTENEDPRRLPTEDEFTVSVDLFFNQVNGQVSFVDVGRMSVGFGNFQTAEQLVNVNCFVRANNPRIQKYLQAAANVPRCSRGCSGPSEL